MIKIIWNTGEEQLVRCSFEYVKTLFSCHQGLERAVLQTEDSYIRLKYSREIIDMDHSDNKDV